MAKKTAVSASPESADLDQLERTVKELVGQVRTLSLIMDEIRDELIYAVRNDRFNAIPEATWRPVESPPKPVAPAPPPELAAAPLLPSSVPPATRRPSTLFG